jgi:hypothetical protein
MSTLLPLAVAFLLMLAVYGLGMSRERARKPLPHVPPNLRCDCQHMLSFHDGLGACQESTEKYIYNKAGNVQKDKETGDYCKVLVPCRCQQYTGPMPEDWYARESLAQAVFTGELPEGTLLPSPVDNTGTRD